MGKNDFSDIEDQIKNTVKNAFDYINFAGVKDSINNYEKTFSEVKLKIKDKSSYFENKMQEISKKSIYKLNYKNGKKINTYISKKPKGRFKGIFYNAAGVLGSVIFGIGLASVSIVDIFTNRFFNPVFNISIGIVSIFFIGSILVALRGLSIRKRIARFKKYSQFLVEKNYCKIEELADSVGKKNKYVIKDLQKMMEMDMFKEGYIDNEKTYFMLSNEVYEDYLLAQESFNKRKEEELKRAEKAEKVKDDPELSEIQSVIENGETYIEAIRDANAAINKSDISLKLNKLQAVIKEIFKCLEKNPNKLPEIKKFINYYLPMTLKLVNSYKELNEQPIEGENIKKAKEEIEKSIDLINVAFEKLLDGLFEEVALDISSDISVLETLFSQEGLTKDEFKK